MRKRSEIKAVGSLGGMEFTRTTATEDRSSVESTPSKTLKSPAGLKLNYDPINEIVIIAATLVDEATRHRLVLRFHPESFLAKGHSDIWKMIVKLDEARLSYDPATVRDLTNAEVDTDYLEELVRIRPKVPPNLDHHVKALERDRVKVQAIKGPVGSFIDALNDPRSEFEEIQMLARQVSDAFSLDSLQYVRESKSLVDEQIEKIKRRQSGQALYPYGIKGFDKYDENAPQHLRGKARIVPGAAPDCTTVITGLSGTGKTTLTTQIAVNFANQKRRVLYGAWEQGSGNTLELMAIQSLNLSRTAFMTGAVLNEEIKLVREEMERLGEFVKFFELPFGKVAKERKGQLNDRHLDLIHGYIVESHCDVFIADLFRKALKEMSPDDEEMALNRMQDITANKAHVHSILIHQQKLKEVEQRIDVRPTREGLKGSGAWVEMPDTIIGTHRPALWKNVPDDRVELFVLKQRYGAWPLAVTCKWNPDSGLITDGQDMEYLRPGQTSEVDSFLGETPTKRGRNGKGNR